MDTNRKTLKYIAAALMFILLAVFLIDNPYEGKFMDPEGYKNIGPSVFLCILYVIIAFWFFNLNWGKKVRSKIYVFGVAVGLIGAVSQLTACHIDYSEYEAEMEYYYDGESDYETPYDIFEEYYPLKEAAFRNILSGFAYMSLITLVGILCTKTRKKYVRYVLYGTLAILLFNVASDFLPLEKVYPNGYGGEWDNYEREQEDFHKSREMMQYISMGLVYFACAMTMAFYKDDEDEAECVSAQEPVVKPVAAAKETVKPVEEAVKPVKEAAEVEEKEPEASEPVEESDETVIDIPTAEENTTMRTSALASGTALQYGRYTIESVLGQGGFGVTYLATQTGLNRKVAIKEFFMKEYCDRDATSNHITMGTAGSKEMVARFKAKFIKEAQTIAELQNQHVVRIYDIFEENGTAYYVMEYIEGGSLAKKVIGNPRDNATALKYMMQISQALKYIHDRNILHLDIKPSNILFRNDNELVLIDFGVSKHYDEDGGSQTSSTPVGISRGYAPLEQYNKGGVIQFSPATDIYSLGATLYSIVTGQIPPDANEIYEDGIDDLPAGVSATIQRAIIKAMDPRRKQRPQSIDEFTNILNS